MKITTTFTLGPLRLVHVAESKPENTPEATRSTARPGIVKCHVVAPQSLRLVAGGRGA